MSIVVIGDQMVHYEVIGRGRPVIFLHGWLGSWRYWFPSMEAVSRDFRAFSFDFWGFGGSQRQHATGGIEVYSSQVIQFLDALGIDRVMLVGHSMGGMVAMKTALDYPERVLQVVTVGAPFQGRSLSWLLKMARYRTLVHTFGESAWLRRNVFRFFIGEFNDPSISEILNDTLKSSADTLCYTVRSMLATDLRPELINLRVPALVMHGGRDDVVSPKQVDLFDHIGAAGVVVLRESRHFPFLDETDLFNDLLVRFLKQNLVTPAPTTDRLQLPTSPITSG